MAEQLPDAVADFLKQQRIAVAGVSRRGDLPANIIYRKLRDNGYTVYAVNPHTATVEGDPCYRSLAELPTGVGGLVIATPPEAAPDLVRQCAEVGVGRVWMHRSIGHGSVSERAVALCHDHGLQVIPGACPMMYLHPVDVPHRCMRWVLGLAGGLPREAQVPARS